MPLPRLRVALLFLAVLVIVNGEAFAFEHNMPGEFDYYALVLGWAPSYCLSEGRLRRNAECQPDKPRAFVLHGLRPQYDKGWPEDCPTGRPWVPSPAIDEMWDIMPSKGLIIQIPHARDLLRPRSSAIFWGRARALRARESAREPVGFRLNKIALSRRDRNRVRILESLAEA